VGSACVLLGIAQAGSPFTLKLRGAWFFGISPSSGTTGPGRVATFLGVMLVYAGVAIMIGSWFEIVRTVRRYPGTALRPVMTIAAAWVLPVLFMPPLFSRDVYSYAAQGALVRQGINPYLHGPIALGPSRYLGFVDPLWRKVPAPYGPAWERLSEAIVSVAHRDVLATVVGFRLVALVGVALIAWGIPVLARSSGRDQTVAFALAILNPLVLLVLVGGAHNDALMLGLLVAGCALARTDHPIIGLALCALAAEVKVPAVIGAAFIGWWWSDPSLPWQRRAPRAAAALLGALGLMALIGAISGLGWHWLGGLSNPGVVVSWLDPATAVGLAAGHIAGFLGLGHHSAVLVRVARGAGLVVAAAISAWLIVRSDRVGPVRALGWSLLVFVVLGPVVWPWYETWGFVFLAVVAEGWTLRLVLFLSAVACFADVPSGRFLGTGDHPVLTVACWTILLAGVITYAVTRLGPSLSPAGPPHLHPREGGRKDPTWR
jgi:hypothetical protein